MEKLLNEQKETIAQIAQFIKNHKKDGNDRKSKLSYYDKKLRVTSTLERI